MSSIILSMISFYKKIVSPVLDNLLGHGCRYTPTCSEYSYTAIKKHGLSKGLYLSIKRILSCRPFSRRSFLDPVPERIY